jgi:hypothetical protein
MRELVCERMIASDRYAIRGWDFLLIASAILP